MLLDTPICDFGWKAGDFTLQDAHGKAHRLTDYLGAGGGGGLLIAFVCNHCPYVKAIGTRFGQDMRDLHAAGVRTLAIMSNDYTTYPEDSPDNMIAFARDNGWDCPYLIDASQEVARAYGAVCTPDFFGFNARGELQYRGRLDDVGMGAHDKGRKRELYSAMMQIADSGQGPQQQTPSMGCSIKWMT